MKLRCQKFCQRWNRRLLPTRIVPSRELSAYSTTPRVFQGFYASRTQGGGGKIIGKSRYAIEHLARGSPATPTTIQSLRMGSEATRVDILLEKTVRLAGALTAGVGKAPHFAAEAAKDSEGTRDQLSEQLRALAADVADASAAIDEQVDAVVAEYGAASKSGQLSQVAALQREHEDATNELRLAGEDALGSLRALRHVQNVALGEWPGREFHAYGKRN